MQAYLKISKPRRAFKRTLGQANHLIVTTLVGLDAIERGLVKNPPEGLRAAWSPKDTMLSARRSRRMVLDMALVRSIDALDVYICMANRKPFLFQCKKLQEELSGCERSVTRRFTAMNMYFLLEEKVSTALAALMIAWRNQAVHIEAKDKLSNGFREIIQSNEEEISSSYSGLDVPMLLDNYDREGSPHFKEIAAFIRATQNYISELERSVFKCMCPQQYLRELVWFGISENKSNGNTEQSRRKILTSIWGKTGRSKERAIKRFLEQQGLSFQESRNIEDSFVLFSEQLNELVCMTPNEVYGWAERGTENSEHPTHEE